MTGGATDNANTELFDLERLSWSVVAKYPFSNIFAHATLCHESKFYIFGGVSATSPQSSVIARYDPVTNVWSKMGNLLTGSRWYQDIIFTEGAFLVIGGIGTESRDTGKNVEKCHLRDDAITCVSEHQLNVGSYPHLFHVDRTYCQNNKRIIKRN